MKYLKTTLFTILGLMLFVSCEDQVGPTVNTDTGNPAITAPTSGAEFMLTKDTAEEELFSMTWTNPDYGFSAAATYVIEMDLAGNNFSNATELASVNGTSHSFLVGELNTKLLAAGVPGNEASQVSFRVRAELSDSLETLYSDPVDLTLTPFLDSFPPIYMIGAGVGGWDPGLAVVVPSDEANVYTTVAEFTGGETFRFFGQQDWGPDSWNYPFFANEGGNIDALLVDAEDGDNNFRFTGESGWYQITANFNTYDVQVEAAEEPVMYMTGAGVGGWDQPGTGASVKMTYIQPGVFEATTEFSNEAFRFFAQADWGPVSYNYPYFSDNNGSVSPLLSDAQGDILQSVESNIGFF